MNLTVNPTPSNLMPLSIESSPLVCKLHAPTVNWRDMKPCDHFVQFYETDYSLVEAVSCYFKSGLEEGSACIGIVTPPHKKAIEGRLVEAGIDFQSGISSDSYLMLDARETLACFMQNGMPDARLFHESVGKIVAAPASKNRPILAFGEMVDLLWSDGNQAAAVRLEELWNILGKSYKFTLFCAYSMNEFAGEGMSEPLKEICSQHSHVIPAESYSLAGDTDERLREITRLQQKASELEAEVARRKEAERALYLQQKEVVALNARLKRAITEMHHRVKNNLQVISATIELQELEYKEKQAVPIEEYGRLKSHVNTLAIVHDLLTLGHQDCDENQLLSIKQVLDRLLPMLEQAAWKRKVSYAVADALLTSKQCVALSLVTNELVSNSLKHGKQGVELSLSVENGQVITEVCDDGIGFPDNFNVHENCKIGLELVESLVVTDLQGKVHFENRNEGGARVRVIFDLPQ
jgi:two-component sensor histidine kinase